MTNGPIQATFLVHEDFYMYKSGVYQHLKLAERKDPKYAKSGYHSVRILGWVRLISINISSRLMFQTF